jgi:hypothetical protein
MTWRSSAGSSPVVGSSRISSAGPGEQLHGHRGAFALPAGELVDPGVDVAGELQFLEHPAHRGGPLLLGGVWQSQFDGIAQGRIQG